MCLSLNDEYMFFESGVDLEFTFESGNIAWPFM